MKKNSSPHPVAQRLIFAERYRFALSRARGIPIETDLSAYNLIIDQILSCDFSGLTDARITKLAREDGTTLADTLALVSEAAARVLGQRLYPVQLVAALALHEGKLAQMATGEGKTLAAVPAAFLGAASGLGCHVLTANDYLARRDAEWMGDVYRMLGRRAAFVNDDTPSEVKFNAYLADVTYLTPRRAGFDFLADQLVLRPEDRIQRPFHMAIVDEADALLIDEARIPLVAARESGLDRVDPNKIDSVVVALVPEEDYVTDRAGRRSVLTPAGHETVRRRLGCPGIEEPDGLPWYAAVNVALHAHHLLTLDEDYIVRDDRIELVDGFTGRVADQRRWPDGIQAALEAKEGLSVQEDGEVCGSITIQHFIGRYPRLSAMTATAVPSARELNEFYDLATVVVPSNRPSRLVYEPDRVFSTRSAKMGAIVDRVSRCKETGQPVLVGTRSVRESEELGAGLRAAGISCSILNARNDEEEARIIAEAGRVGAVTISTNMAGRGTDIHLGGMDESDHDRVVSLGGLCVIGTNCHESSRIDQQLSGRAARQGDPGVACSYMSLEDDLVQRYAIIDLIPAEHREPGDRAIDDPSVSREIRRAQTIIEEQHFTMRRTLRDYSELIERRRRELEHLRDMALFGQEVPEALAVAVDLAGAIDTIDAADRRRALSICYMQALDSAWAEFLEWIGIVREGIHLRRYSGRAPILEFVDAASEQHELTLDRGIHDAMIRYNRWLAASPDEREQLARPSSTWTYLISDNPFPHFSVAGIAGGNVLAAVTSALFAPIWAVTAVLQRLFGPRKHTK